MADPEASSTIPAAPAAEAGRFLQKRPKDLRRATPWHRYAHHIRTLPARLQAMVVHLHVPRGGNVLDYGCADAPYRAFFPADVDFVTADLAGNPNAVITLNQDATVPVDDGSFDAVLSTQVLEHVTDPKRYLGECFRVLRPGGRLLLSTHGVFVYHPDPVDLWRWTCDGLRETVGAAGFEVERFEGVIGLAATGLQLFQDAIYFHVPAVFRPILALVVQSSMALADRIQSQRSKDLNAAVFVLVARKPESSAA